MRFFLKIQGNLAIQNSESPSESPDVLHRNHEKIAKGSYFNLKQYSFERSERYRWPLAIVGVL